MGLPDSFHRRYSSIAKPNHGWPLWVILTSVLLLIPACQNSGTSGVDILGTDESIFHEVDIEDRIRDASQQSQQAAARPLDLELVTPQHFLVMLIDGQGLRDYLKSRGKEVDPLLLEPKPETISFQDVQSLLLMVDESLIGAMQAGGTPSGGWALQLSFSQPVQQQPWQKWLLGPTSQSAEIGNQQVQMAGDGSLGLMWVNQQKAVLGTRSELEAIQKRLGQTIPSAMSRRMQQTYQGEFIFGELQAAPLQVMVDRAAQWVQTLGQADQRMTVALAGARSLDFVQFQADLSQAEMARVKLQFSDVSAAEGIQSLVNQMIDQISTMTPGGPDRQRPQANNPAAGISAELQKLLSDVQAEFASGGVQSEQDQKQVTVTLQRPKKLDELLDQSLDGWQTAKRQMYQSRKMGTLAAALHQFQKEHGHLPSNNASPLIYVKDEEAVSVDNTEAAPQFSWRVALLPQLGHDQLYQKFDFHQPWDSPHNQEVARQMPSVFAWDQVPDSGDQIWVTEDGQVPESDVHMVTGEGAAGQGIVDPSEVIDGADRTVLIQQTPRLKSAWTSPDAGWQVTEPNEFLRMKPNQKEVWLCILYSGRVVGIAPDLTPEDWFQWVTPAGKERINRTQFRQNTVFAPIEEQE